MNDKLRFLEDLEIMTRGEFVSLGCTSWLKQDKTSLQISHNINEQLLKNVAACPSNAKPEHSHRPNVKQKRHKWLDVLGGKLLCVVRSEGFPRLLAGGSKYCQLSIVFPVKEISGSMDMWERFKEVLAHFPPTHTDPLWPHFYTSFPLWGKITLFRAFERYENLLARCRWENCASESEAWDRDLLWKIRFCGDSAWPIHCHYVETSRTQRKSYGFRIRPGWVNNDLTFIVGWSVLLIS